MTRTPEEHGARFDEKAADYDDDQSEEYRRCADLVISYASPGSEETVLDIGTGTGEIALALAPEAKRVLGRDVSEGMLDRARRKADLRGIETVAFDEGRFRELRVSEPVDVVVSNFAMHHLADEEKRAAIDAIADLGPGKFVLGDVMFFGKPDPNEPFFSPEVDDPATVGVLADALTDAGFALTAVESVGSESRRGGDGEAVEAVHDQVGVLVAERTERAGRIEEPIAGRETDDVTDSEERDAESGAATSEGPIVPDEGGTASHEE